VCNVAAVWRPVRLNTAVSTKSTARAPNQPTTHRRYGDIVARTWGGQITTVLMVCLAAAFFAISPGIVGTSFALKYQESKKSKRKVCRQIFTTKNVYTARNYSACTLSRAVFQRVVISCNVNAPAAKAQAAGGRAFHPGMVARGCTPPGSEGHHAQVPPRHVCVRHALAPTRPLSIRTARMSLSETAMLQSGPACWMPFSFFSPLFSLFFFFSGELLCKFRRPRHGRSAGYANSTAADFIGV
jgi:hypothetical protein